MDDPPLSVSRNIGGHQVATVQNLSATDDAIAALRSNASGQKREPLATINDRPNHPAAIRARPSATETNSPPPASFAAPKRSANRRRTAGTKAVPPVRKTRSILAWDRPAVVSAWSTVAPRRARSSAIQDSKSVRVMWRSTAKSLWPKRRVVLVACDRSALAVETA